MKIVIQRVKRASVTVDKKKVGKIDKGILALVGVGKNDNVDIAKWCADKMVNLRIFEDKTGKMNLSLKEVEGAILLVSQFTLYGDTKRGKRPSFSSAAPPEMGRKLYEFMKDYLVESEIHVETGIFGAMMDVELINDGPVTLIIEKE